MNNKSIILPIKEPWYSMILSGEKKEEYREIKDYYRTRFANLLTTPLGDPMKKEQLDEWLISPLRFSLNVVFRNGYRSDSPSFTAKCRLKIGTGRPKWGAEPDMRYYILEIIEIIRCDM